MIGAIIVLAITLLIAFTLAMCYIADTNRHKRALEDITHYLDGVEGKNLHDEWRISQARQSAERALCKRR